MFGRKARALQAKDQEIDDLNGQLREAKQAGIGFHLAWQTADRRLTEAEREIQSLRQQLADALRADAPGGAS